MSESVTVSFHDEASGYALTVTITEGPDGTLVFDLQIQDTGTLGDVRAIYFDFGNDALIDTLAVEGDDVTDFKTGDEKVSTLGGDTNMNGEVIKTEDGKFDVGVEFGTQGIGKDDVQSTTFTLSSTDGTPLTLDMINEEFFGLRVTSVGEEGSRDGSLKMGEESEMDLAPAALDDGATVDEGATISLNILDNDTAGDGATTITAVEGATQNADGSWTLSVTTALGSTGTVTIDAAGNLLLDTAGFAGLDQGELDTVSFDYTIADEDGDTATATVTLNVNGLSDGGGNNPLPMMVQGSISVQEPVQETQAIVVMIEASDLTKQQNSSLQPTGDMNGDAFASTLLDQALTGVWDLANELVASGRGDQVIDVVVFAASTREVSFTAQDLADGYTMTSSGLLATGSFTAFDGIEENLTSDNGDIDYNAALTKANDILDLRDADDSHAILLTAQNDSDGTGYAAELAELQAKAQVEAIAMNPALGVMDDYYNLDMAALADFINALDDIDSGLADILDDGGIDPADFLAGVASRLSLYSVEDAVDAPDALPTYATPVVTSVDIKVGDTLIEDVAFTQNGTSFEVGGVMFENIEEGASVDIIVDWTDSLGAAQTSTFAGLEDADLSTPEHDFSLMLG